MSLGVQRWDFCPPGCKVTVAHPSVESASQSGKRGRSKGAKVKVKGSAGHLEPLGKLS